jgi:hypothetical protein
MNRAKDLDTVAPDDPIIVEPKLKVKPLSSIKITNATKTIKADSPPSPFQQKVYNIFGHTKHSFSSLLVKPHVFDFQERHEDEEILIVGRRHWFTNVSWIITTVFLLFIPTFLTFVPLSSFISSRYHFISILFWYLITFAFSFEKFLSWYFNVYIITTRRVVDIDFNNLLVKKYSDAEIGMIQDVTSAVIGAIPTVFNYGNVLIQTASEVNEIVFERVPNPEKIIKILQELREKENEN